MRTLSQKMAEFRRILKLHANWLLYATVGESALTTSELADLHAYGKLPMGEALDLVDKSYFVGRMRSTMKASEFKKVDSIVTPTLTPVEEQALEAAKHKSILRLSKVADMALGEKGSAEGWSKAVRTEFQTAKIQGIANTIANKSDLYASSDGADSDVSVVPGRQCCEDCRQHYLEPDGNPKVFKLSDLMSSGSNADAGTIHTKTAGKHTHWKTTLPPLHPSCGCTLMYVPPGHGWVGGKLSVLNKSLFLEHISKATAGVRGPGISPTVAPQGAPSVRQEPGHPSVPGAAAPGNVAGPGRPPGLSPKPGSGTGGPGGGKQLQACPWQKCPIGHHEPGSATAKEHAEIAMRNHELTPAAEDANRKQNEANAKAFNGRDHKQQVVHDHLSSGKISSMRKLGGDEAGVNASYKITIEGNGSGIMKPHISVDSYVPSIYGEKAANKSPDQLRKMADSLTCPGAGTMPEGMNPKSEAGMSGLANGLGLNHMFPVTTLRTHDGSQDGPKGVTSVQHWNDNAVSTDKYAGEGSGYREILKAAPKEHQDKMHEQFSTIAVMDVISNNGDRHLNNVMVDKNSHDLVPIDHGTAFGNGLSGCKNDIAQEMHGEGVALKIPPQLHEKLKNQSMDATFRSLDESGLPEWSKAQTYLRQKYVLHMQEKFDHIPFDRIRPTVTARQGDVAPYWNASNGQCHGWMDKGGVQGFFQAQENKELPHDQFNGFAKAWMEKRVNDPSHPEHQDAKRLFAMQPLRTSGHVTGREEATTESLSKHYDSIPSYDLEEPSAAFIKNTMPANKKFSDEAKVSVRTPPEMPKGTGAAKPSNKMKGTGAAKPSNKMKESTIPLQDEDLEEVDPNKNYSKDAFQGTGIQLDLSEFDDDSDIDQAFDRIRKKSGVQKSLYLAQPHAIFGVDRKPGR